MAWENYVTALNNDLNMRVKSAPMLSSVNDAHSSQLKTQVRTLSLRLMPVVNEEMPADVTFFSSMRKKVLFYETELAQKKESELARMVRKREFLG